ncbi:MAG TPA: enoyl-CoA hydratase-related protein [Acidimicrobiia bacterium]|nr:enoyl-CoA hydratase-related protein [Acidimicrobiia bacterium]
MEQVRYDVEGAVARITIDRPERLNALSFQVMAELAEALDLAKADDAVRVVVLTGAGEKAFCAGADLGGIGSNAGPAAMHEARGRVAGLFRQLWALGKPTIARVRGYCLAGGFGLALACDIVIAADDAVFGTPEVDIGLWPYQISVPLLRAMPPKKVLELMMTGRRVKADEADRIGFVNQVVPVAGLDAAVDEMAATLAAKSPVVMRWGRDSFYRVLNMAGDDALDYLHSMLTVSTLTEDAAEGLGAFAEKRKPQWTGR